uniref:Lysosomal Pro-X carboxypeptidase n=1 Tax=Aegilops tauschii TaxID=37682 RepID=N1QTF5_AEGTA
MAASSLLAAILALQLLLLLVAFTPAPAAAASPSQRPIHQPPSFPAGISTLRRRAASSSGRLATEAVKPFTAHYFPQELDHFTFTPNSSRVFSQKYLLNDTFWRKPTGPLFVYMGGEADIEWLATTTGFMFDIAPEFGALIVFIEVLFFATSSAMADTFS